jgi:hypothetical protein
LIEIYHAAYCIYFLGSLCYIIGIYRSNHIGFNMTQIMYDFVLISSTCILDVTPHWSSQIENYHIGKTEAFTLRGTNMPPLP